MPFRLFIAPATFQILMNDLFKPYHKRFILVFFDDISIIQQNQPHLEKSKCLFSHSSVECLGHIVSKDGVATNHPNLRQFRSGLY